MSAKTHPLRCQLSGNPCGTDTTMLGMPCQCDTCLAAKVLEAGAIDHALIRGDYINVDWKTEIITAQQADLQRHKEALGRVGEVISNTDLPWIIELESMFTPTGDYIWPIGGKEDA